MRRLLVLSFVSLLPWAAAAQTGSGVNSGLNSDSGSMMGPNVNVVNGTNANGTPRQQSPGSSMTNGAGNSTMTPGVSGGGGASVTTPPAIGTTKGTIAPSPTGPAPGTAP
jgi:hypothetical protein